MDVARPWLGFIVKENPELQKVFITEVAKGGPADVSQIKVGEELVSMIGVPTKTTADFRNAISRLQVGMATPIELRTRDAKLKIIQIVPAAKQSARDIIKDIPPLQTIDDVKLTLLDEAQMKKLNRISLMLADAECHGYVTREEFYVYVRTFLRAPFERLSDDQVVSLFGYYDANQNGYLSPEEFFGLIQDLLVMMVENGALPPPPPPPTPAAPGAQLASWNGFATWDVPKQYANVPKKAMQPSSPNAPYHLQKTPDSPELISGKNVKQKRQQSTSNITYAAIFCFCIQLIVMLGSAVAHIIVYVKKRDEYCDKKLAIWTLVYGLGILLMLPVAYLSNIFKSSSKRSVGVVILMVLSGCLTCIGFIFFVVWFVIGNIWAWGIDDKKCDKFLWWWVISWLIATYCICALLIVCSLFCLCVYCITSLNKKSKRRPPPNREIQYSPTHNQTEDIIHPAPLPFSSPQHTLPPQTQYDSPSHYQPHQQSYQHSPQYYPQ